jgi:DNA repair photolyase
VPYLSDSPAQLAAAVRQIAASGASHVTPIVLHLRPGTREWFMSWLRTAHPELLPRYAELYGRGAYAPRTYAERIVGQVRELAKQYGVGRAAAGNRRPAGRAPAAALNSDTSLTPAATPNSATTLTPAATPASVAPGAQHEQLTLL